MITGEKRTELLLELLRQLKSSIAPGLRCLDEGEVEALLYLGGAPGRGNLPVVSCRHCPMSGVVSDEITGHNYTCHHINGPFRLNMDVKDVHRDCPLRDGPMLVYLTEEKRCVAWNDGET